MNQTEFDTLFDNFNNIKIGVVGDAMLDTYWWGRVERISPEAPVPIVTVSKREQRIGGAANVALNAKSLGCKVHMLTIVGNDGDGNQLINLLNKSEINTDYLIKSDLRITTNKIRIISKNQQMMRLDAEMTNAIDTQEENNLLLQLTKYIQTEKPHIVILEDYNKGVLTEKIITESIRICHSNNVLVAVDPKRKNFFCYKNADIFKPNLQEAKDALNIVQDELNEDFMNSIHASLYENLQHKASFITLSEKGVYYNDGNESKIIPTHVRTIADVSGAGDTVIAVAAIVYAATQNFQLMAELANIAGGLVCEEVGTVAIDKNKLLAEAKSLLIK
jgi:rfaE bifunctional protein kinase chain/domain